MRLIGSGLALLLLSAPAASTPSGTQTASTLLAETRQALGGAAALDAVRTFSARGEIESTLGNRTFVASLAIDAVLPDRFLRTRRQMTDSPFGSGVVTNYDGFNRDEVIRRSVAANLPPPPEIIGGPTTPEEIAAAAARRLRGARRAFVPQFLALFAASPEAYPLTFSSPGRLDLPDGPVDLIEALDSTDGAWLMFLDPETRLAGRITWMGRPRVVVSSQSVVGVNRGTGETRTLSEPTPLPADPTAGMGDVEWTLELRDYRLVDGRLWPHRLVLSAGGEVFEDIRISEYSVNPEIDLAIFEIPG